MGYADKETKDEYEAQHLEEILRSKLSANSMRVICQSLDTAGSGYGSSFVDTCDSNKFDEPEQEDNMIPACATQNP